MIDNGINDLFDDDDLDDLRAEAAAEKAYLRAYLAHPNPADPDYPEPIELKDEE